MLKAITHYDQISVGLVMEILERDKRTKESEESRAHGDQNLEIDVPTNAASKEGS